MELKTYCPGLAELRLITPEDVKACLQDFLKRAGKPLATIVVNIALLDPTKAPLGFEKKYRLASPGFFEALAGELQAQGVELAGDRGVLGWEVRLAEKSPRTAPNRPAQGQEPVIISLTPEKIPLPPHRPVVYGEKIEARVQELAGEGLGARAIKRTLEAEGSAISLPTVSRKLAGIRQGRLL